MQSLATRWTPRHGLTHEFRPVSGLAEKLVFQLGRTSSRESQSRFCVTTDLFFAVTAECLGGVSVSGLHLLTVAGAAQALQG